MRKCKGCYQEKEMYNRSRTCKDCYDKREARRYLENKLKNEPWRYVECGGDCSVIWRLEKKKLGEGGSKVERYSRSRCPDCGSHALCFVGTGFKINTEKLKRSLKCLE